MVKKIAIFASGNGSNAENVYNYFKGSTRVKVVLIATNKKDAFVVKRAKNLRVSSFVFSKDDLINSVIVEQKLLDFEVDFIVLSGFLLKIPGKIINLFSDKIINIHPSLLPKFGGKGMYGKDVHKSVIENNERESGITIHYVNSNYDKGGIILQERCFVSKKETVQSLSEKIRKLEFSFFPKTIEKIILK